MNREADSQPILQVHQGELISPRRLYFRGALFLLVPLAWILPLLFLPSLLLVAIGFMGRGDYGDIEWSFTLENYRRLAGYGSFGWSADTLRILWRSLVMAAVTTAFSLLLAYPLAFFIATRKERSRYLWLALVVVPICTNLVIRTAAWMLILEAGMPLARLAHAFGLIPADTPLYPSIVAVYLGMVSQALPFAALPLYASVERMDWSLVEAAQDLYASRTRVFRHAILPQTLPGLAAAAILTFIPSLGIFVVPDLLGGSKSMMIGNLIQQQFGASRDWPFGAAISFGLMALTLAGLFSLRRKEPATGAHRGGLM